tara:strand:- start:971 stop:1129 length:159 start_codon:yes stop_codon:yes gene_type:complete
MAITQSMRDVEQYDAYKRRAQREALKRMLEAQREELKKKRKNNKITPDQIAK